MNFSGIFTLLFVVIGSMKMPGKLKKYDPITGMYQRSKGEK